MNKQEIIDRVTSVVTNQKVQLVAAGFVAGVAGTYVGKHLALSAKIAGSNLRAKINSRRAEKAAASEGEVNPAPVGA